MVITCVAFVRINMFIGALARQAKCCWCTIQQLLSQSCVIIYNIIKIYNMHTCTVSMDKTLNRRCTYAAPSQPLRLSDCCWWSSWASERLPRDTSTCTRTFPHWPLKVGSTGSTVSLNILQLITMQHIMANWFLFPTRYSKNSRNCVSS